MYEINDPKKIKRWVHESGILDILSLPDPVFRAYVYNKEEMIVAPFSMLSSLMAIAEGTAKVYTIREDGAKIPIAVLGKSALLGDMEFYTGKPTRNYVEAESRVICIGLPFSEYRESLHQDVRFLHALLDSFHRKLCTADDDLVSKRLEDRLIDYMLSINPGHELNGVESALYPLHCSRRQLQRVLKKLCDSGKIERFGKGRYRLSDR